MLLGFQQLPFPVRALIVLLTAAVLARFINWAIYTWAYYRRSLGPWSPPAKADSRTWFDHLPVLGWYALRREEKQHGKAFWIRPLLIELIFPLFVTWYYVRYTNGELPLGTAAKTLTPAALTALHWQFLGHLILLALMTIATFIDFDEQSIPDYVTVPGTLLGLLGCAFATAWLPMANATGQELLFSFPFDWPLAFSGSTGLAVGISIALIWGFALLDRRWISRRGFGKAIQYFFAKLIRNRFQFASVVVATGLMLILIGYSYSYQNGTRWPYLLSSLLGLAFAGGITWGVRITAYIGLRMEALGFGDVTLMAMIGTYLGWHPSLLVFFIAPFVAILIVVVRAIITGQTATPYGPYLCAAVVILMVYWVKIWPAAAPSFILGELVLWIVVGCIVLMGGMLWSWRLVKEAYLAKLEKQDSK